MKTITAMFVVLGIAVGSSAVSAETVQGGIEHADALETQGEPAVDDVEDVSQPMALDCTVRTCESCSGGLYRTKTVKYVMGFPNGVLSCSSHIASVTYGPCQSSCAL